jgi:hypothetical protein
MRLRRFIIGLALSVLAVPAFSQEMGYYGIGPRVGASSDPDQVVGGIHFNFGEFVPRLRFQPNLELGLGDDYTIISATAPVHYRFKVDANVVPYAGGGLTLAFVNFDPPQGDDETDFEIGAKAVGGVEWPLSGNNAFFVELNVGFGDIPDVQVMAGWMFGAASSGSSDSGPSKATP